MLCYIKDLPPILKSSSSKGTDQGTERQQNSRYTTINKRRLSLLCHNQVPAFEGHNFPKQPKKVSCYWHGWKDFAWSCSWVFWHPYSSSCKHPPCTLLAVYIPGFSGRSSRQGLDIILLLSFYHLSPCSASDFSDPKGDD